MGEQQLWKYTPLLLTFCLVVASAGQALFDPEEIPHPLSKGGSLATWDDDFFDASQIDLALSYNYTLNTSSGLIFMKNTCDAWINTDFTRMKPIEVTNSGADWLYDYVFNITISYDTDMQPDFDDIRFTDDQGTQLS